MICSFRVNDGNGRSISDEWVKDRVAAAPAGSGGADFVGGRFTAGGKIDDVDGPPRPQRKGAILSRHNSDKEPRHGF